MMFGTRRLPSHGSVRNTVSKKQERKKCIEHCGVLTVKRFWAEFSPQGIRIMLPFVGIPGDFSPEVYYQRNRM